MKPSSREAVVGLVLIIGLLAAALPADEPAKKIDAVKPPWQRQLGFLDRLKAVQQENQLMLLQEAGKFADALKVATTLAELRSKVQGADHWETVNARFAAEAIRRAQKAKKEDQQSYCRILAQQRQAGDLAAKEKYRDALTVLEQVLAVRRKVLGEDHPDTGTSYHDVGYMLHELGKSREAEDKFRKALVIFRGTVGEDAPDTANCYNSLAANRNDLGRYQEAEKDFHKALAIRRQVLGENHPDTAVSYNNMASNLVEQGKYAQAEENYRKSLTVLRKLLGEEAADTTTAYNNLAYILGLQGKFKEEEEVFRKALAIRRKVLGEDHTGTALSYNNLAATLDEQGRHAEAEAGHRKALAIRLEKLGEEHHSTAESYGNLATSQQAQFKYKEAEENHRRALAIRLRVLGEKHPETALSYGNLAFNQYVQGKHQKAEEDFRKALAIRLSLLGEDHPSTATSLGNLAGCLNAQGKQREAEEDFRKALAVRRQALGEQHPDTAQSYNNVGHILLAQGKYTEAENYFIRAAQSIDKARLQVGAAGLERATFTSEHSQLPALSAVLARNGKLDDAWQRFEESLARGTWDDLSARLRRPQAEREKQSQLSARIDRLQKLIERASVGEPTPEQSKQREKLLSQLRQTYDELAGFTRQLEKKYGPIAGQVSARGPIQAALPQDAALIAWLDIAAQPKAVDPNGEHWAILLRSAGAPVWVRLTGSGTNSAWTDADTKLPARLREALQSPRGLWQPFAARLRKQRLDPLAPHLQGVRRLIVLPSTALAGVPLEVIVDGYTVSYAHSGTMYAYLLRQPAAGKGLFVLADPVFDPPAVKEKPLPLPPGGVLITAVLPGSNASRAGLRSNDVLLRYVDRDLNAVADLKPQPESKDPDKRVSIVFWRDGKTQSNQRLRPGELGVVLDKEPAPQAVAEQRRRDRLLVATRGGENGKWDRLPGSRIEAASLLRLFDKDAPVQPLLDSEASEQRLNELAKRAELAKYRYIHLATHGEVDNVFPLRSAVILSGDRLPDEKQRTSLLVSGQPIPDGRLQADEALQRWNLHADLVTLSACQSALGKYERGEGFVGFAQSLILCGSRSVCLSLWKVDDVATALLMERFYQNLLGKRDGLKAPMTKAAALAEAKAWLRDLPRSEAVKRAAWLTDGVSRGNPTSKSPSLEVPPAAAKAKRDDRPFSHPRYWAAFILIGHAD